LTPKLANLTSCRGLEQHDIVSLAA
jgi:hypothetical protein